MKSRGIAKIQYYFANIGEKLEITPPHSTPEAYVYHWHIGPSLKRPDEFPGSYRTTDGMYTLFVTTIDLATWLNTQELGRHFSEQDVVRLLEALQRAKCPRDSDGSFFTTRAEIVERARFYAAEIKRISQEIDALPRCQFPGCDEPAEMSASLGRCCPEHYDEMS